MPRTFRDLIQETSRNSMIIQKEDFFCPVGLSDSRGERRSEGTSSEATMP